MSGDAQDAAPARAEAGAATDEWSGRHPVNVRLSLPLGLTRYYVTVVCGRERRSGQRLKVERRRHPLFTAGNLAFFVALAGLVGLAILVFVSLLGASFHDRV